MTTKKIIRESHVFTIKEIVFIKQNPIEVDQIKLPPQDSYKVTIGFDDALVFDHTVDCRGYMSKIKEQQEIVCNFSVSTLCKLSPQQIDFDEKKVEELLSSCQSFSLLKYLVEQSPKILERGYCSEINQQQADDMIWCYLKEVDEKRKKLSKVLSLDDFKNSKISENDFLSKQIASVKEILGEESVCDKEVEDGINGYAHVLGHKRWIKPEEFGGIVRELSKLSVPEEGGIIVYFDEKRLTHTGIIKELRKDENHIFESKWGELPAIFTDSLNTVPTDYGNYVAYFKKPSLEEVENMLGQILETENS
ncbi:hypothetical protein [Candidatus Bodocaedibacter vickermanii]|uniref:Uncharacterized protein n=1 Tax=Candidatus Bodocaedibacter vickermanii TaxID=2741701 RepID=A0A7L9RSY9_9PROT|nr:hypothetical protein CPBP_00423 [Candidatus Paracaedibacteraceae bacterium 'Lake Konstanz']